MSLAQDQTPDRHPVTTVFTYPVAREDKVGKAKNWAVSVGRMYHRPREEKTDCLLTALRMVQGGDTTCSSGLGVLVGMVIKQDQAFSHQAGFGWIVG